ncbi:hypothetical protein V1294_000536 [Bradyrhizobium sp. AZCC 1678]|uniref:Uncharacterized protein n=1 Tax=Bradyrhizobium algeriense TaxID=634784 RepID=A0ABU8BLD0_9BRAD
MSEKRSTTGLKRLSAVSSRASSVRSFATAIRASGQMILAAETWYRTVRISVKGLDGMLSSSMTTWKFI